jgi:glutathione synthase/RimK-type ligase-like ATP-grasp enzyme
MPHSLYWSAREERVFMRELFETIKKSKDFVPLFINLRTLGLKDDGGARAYVEKTNLAAVIHHGSPYYAKSKREEYMQTVELLEKLVPFTSSLASHAIAHDKLKTKQALREKNIPVLPEKIVISVEELLEASSGDERYVVKPLQGGAGRGVKLIKNAGGELFLHRKGKWSGADFKNTETGILLTEKDFPWNEKYVYEPMMIEPYFNDDERGFSSIRATVVGKRVVEAVERINKKDIASNVAQGGKARTIILTPLQENLAIAAAAAVGADFAGVDFLVRGGETVVGEINIGPLTVFSATTGVDVALALFERMLQKISVLE